MNSQQQFKWFSVDDVLPEDVVMRIKNEDDYINPEKTIDVLIRFINLRRENEDVMVIMAHRYLSMTTKNNEVGWEWLWSVEWYGPVSPINLKEMQITHWVLIPELEE